MILVSHVVKVDEGIAGRLNVCRGFPANRNAPNERPNFGTGEELHPRFDSVGIALCTEQVAPFSEHRPRLLQNFQKRLVHHLHDWARSSA